MSEPLTGRLAVRFPALGTEVFVAVRRPADLPAARHLAETVLTDVDEVCSRFRDDSDLRRANRHPGQWVEVDPLLVEAVRVAQDAASLTDGLVDPLLGRTLVQLGYDRDFRLLEQLGETHDVAGDPPSPDAWKLIGLGVDTLRVPDGTELDLGATGKAWSADLIASAWEDAGLGPAVVSVGGDLRVASPDGTPWVVDVSEHPGAPADTTVTLSHGGLATSSTQVRRWTRHGVRRHHLLDPRTGRPTSGPWRTATAVGETCVAANTATTAALVLGADAPAWLDEHAVTARLVAHDGALRHLGGWPIPEAPPTKESVA